MIGDFFEDFDLGFFGVVLAVLLTMDLSLMTWFSVETGAGWFFTYVIIATYGGKMGVAEDD